MTDTPSFAEIRETLVNAAKAAAGRTLPLFRSPLAIDNKYQVGFDPVTEADRGAEDAIRSVIEARFPDHAIIGEERATKETGSRYSWVIDPVDGTRAFITGVPLWGTLIGFGIEGRMRAGIMSQPYIGETFLAVPGESSSLHNGVVSAMRTSSVKSLKTARMGSTTPELFVETGEPDLLRALTTQTLTIRYGLDCYGYALLAAGHIDLVIEPRLNTYDIAALIPIIEEAGGVVTNWQGGRVDGGGNAVAAATPELHADAMTLIAQHVK